MNFWAHAFVLVALVATSVCKDEGVKDITTQVFGDVKYVLPAAYGDFNSDFLIDMFVLTNDSKTMNILLASGQDTLFRENKNMSCSFPNKIISVIPGDFDGDALMDVLVVTEWDNDITMAYVLWGGLVTLNCSKNFNITMKGQPIAIDHNQDMIIDLFGEDKDGKRCFWIFNSSQIVPEPTYMQQPKDLPEFASIKRPHSNAYINLHLQERNYFADLVVATDKYFEIWKGVKGGFEYHRRIHLPEQLAKVGQFLFVDVQLKCELDLVLPVCFSESCDNATIAVYSRGNWHYLQLVDATNTKWAFVPPGTSELYVNTITLRAGDFNLDGYPDLLATVKVGSQYRSVLLMNVESKNGDYGRTFEIDWQILSPLGNDTVMATFYDFKQNGLLDVVLVRKVGNVHQVSALGNYMDYDTNFATVMVITGLTNEKFPIAAGSLGEKKGTYGTNLPGPSITFKTTTQEGLGRCGHVGQLPQSAHFALGLPFVTLGLGRTPNFIDMLIVGIGGENREYPQQVIPNSQVVIIPNPINDPNGWKIQLFVTPSDLILQSAIALTCICILIMFIILGLYWKERREDKIEKLQEAHRFHFDAM